MYKCSVRLRLVLLLVFYLVSCSPANNKPTQIRFSSDRTAIVFSAIDPAGLLQIKNTPHIDVAYTELISVLQTPSDGDSTGMESSVAGRVHVTDSTVVFTPLEPFVPGRNYLVVSYLNARFGDAGMLVSGKLNHSVKPQQVILKR